MSSFTQLTYHLVFATKFRHPLIVDSVRENLYAYIGGIIRAKKGSLIQIGGVEDHLHILAHLSPLFSISETLREIKANSAKWFNEREATSQVFSWQKGYGAFTVSYSQIPIVKRYIENQREHHRQLSFREEYMEILKRHGLAFREEYLFEDEHHG
jgi:REP element-mobilizing transposase RayT